MELIVGCKKCKKVFKKDLMYAALLHRCPAFPYTVSRQQLEDADEYCPFCDNHFVIEAATPQPVIAVEGDDPRLVRDHRMRQRDISLLE